MKKETLTVELEAVDNAPLPEVTTLEITDGETGSFGPINYTKPGYYVYTVRQRAGVNTRGTYDETVYYLRVSVVWDNDKLVAVQPQDDSHLHAGHAGNHGGGHYRILVVSPAFAGIGRLQRQRMVKQPLADWFADNRIHALSIRALTPEEYQSEQESVS